MAETLPVFPLGTVLMPGATLPLHIFEPRYRQLTIDLVTGAVPDKQFGVVAVREGFSLDLAGIDGVEAIGCSAELADVRRLPDGRFDIVTRGVRRFRLLDLDADAKPYLIGSVEYLPDRAGDAEGEADADLTRMLVASAREAHRRYCTEAWKNDDWSEPPADVTATDLPSILAADCLLTLADRQALLEESSPTQRLRMVRMLLARETGLLGTLHAVPAPLSTYAVEHSTN